MIKRTDKARYATLWRNASAKLCTSKLLRALVDITVRPPKSAQIDTSIVTLFCPIGLFDKLIRPMIATSKDTT